MDPVTAQAANDVGRDLKFLCIGARQTPRLCSRRRQLRGQIVRPLRNDSAGAAPGSTLERKEYSRSERLLERLKMRLRPQSGLKQLPWSRTEHGLMQPGARFQRLPRVSHNAVETTPFPLSQQIRCSLDIGAALAVAPDKAAPGRELGRRWCRVHGLLPVCAASYESFASLRGASA